MKPFVLHQAIRVALVSLTAGSLIIACSTPADQAVKPARQTQPVAYVDGKISFATGNDFNTFVGKEFRRPFEQYTAELQRIAPVGSRQARVGSDEEQDDDVVNDPYLSALLNSERELVIEGVTYRMTRVGTFAFSEDKRSRAVELIRKAEASGGKLGAGGRRSARESSQTQDEFIPIDENIYYYPSEGPEVDYSGGGGVPITPSSPGPTDGCGTTSNSVTRAFNGDFGGFADNLKGWNALRQGKDLKAVVWSENWGIVSTAGIKSVNQQRGWTGVWRRDDADFLSWQILSGTMEFKDAVGNFFLVNLTGDDLNSSRRSMARDVFDVNSAKFKIVGYLPIPISVAKTYKIKNLRSCHYVRDEGMTAQVKLEIN